MDERTNERTVPIEGICEDETMTRMHLIQVNVIEMKCLIIKLTVWQDRAVAAPPSVTAILCHPTIELPGVGVGRKGNGNA